MPVGAMAVFFGTVANSHMQIWSALSLRGRVMAIYTLLTLGTTVVGGPFVGWICQQWSPRTGLAVAGVATLSAAVLLALPLTSGLRTPVVEPPVTRRSQSATDLRSRRQFTSNAISREKRREFTSKPGREMAAEKVPDEFPPLLGRVDAEVRTIDGEERVAGVLEGVELVRLAMRAERSFDLRGLLR